MAPSIATLAKATRVGLEAARTSEIERRARQDHQAMKIAICSLLGPSDDAIDVGAHEGETIRHMVQCAPQGRHLAVEPLPEYATELRDRMGPKVIVEEYALCERDDEQEIGFVHALQPSHVSGDGHLQEQPLRAPRRRFQRLRVQSISLDALVERHGLEPKVIRIDVEGAETLVLEGARRTIERYRPVLMIEHGTAAATHGDTSSLFFDLVEDLGLRIYDFTARGPYDRADFLKAVGPFGSFNFLLRP